MSPVPVIALDHPAALDVARVGDDAATLAQARRAGLPVGPGVVLTTSWDSEDASTVEQLWRIVSQDGALALSVRPSPLVSSAIEPAHVVHSATDLLAAARELRAADRGDVPILVQTTSAHDVRGVLIAEGDSKSSILHIETTHGAWVGELDAAGRLRRVLVGDHLGRPDVALLARLVRLGERISTVIGDASAVEFAVAGSHASAVHIRRSTPAAMRLAAEQFEAAA